jgi:undecaprenyl-diphosphatase
MTIVHALLLGILQGLTEFIPVSSTAHLLVGEHFLGLDPHDPTLFSFSVLIQLGTLVSLFIFYWKDLLNILGAALRFVPTLTRSRSAWSLTPDTWLGFYIILATLPALLAGYLLKDAVEALFRYPLLEAAIRFFAAAILLSLAERLARKNRQLNSMTWLDALIVGLFQVIAIFPGASRSGTTISGGMFRGFDRPAAARFAFLMSVPVMLAAGAYEILDVLQVPNLGDFLAVLAVGFISAGLVGWLAIRWLISYLGRGSLYVFAAYCALAGTTTLLIYFSPIGF